MFTLSHNFFYKFLEMRWLVKTKMLGSNFPPIADSFCAYYTDTTFHSLKALLLSYTANNDGKQWWLWRQYLFFQVFRRLLLRVCFRSFVNNKWSCFFKGLLIFNHCIFFFCIIRRALTNYQTDLLWKFYVQTSCIITVSPVYNAAFDT